MSHIAKPLSNCFTFDVPTLAHFVRVNYGAAAHNEVVRRIANYVHENQHGIAEVWSRILDDIQTYEAKKSNNR